MRFKYSRHTLDLNILGKYLSMLENSPNQKIVWDWPGSHSCMFIPAFLSLPLLPEPSKTPRESVLPSCLTPCSCSLRKFYISGLPRVDGWSPDLACRELVGNRDDWDDIKDIARPSPQDGGSGNARPW